MRPLKDYLKQEEYGFHYIDDNNCYYENLESFLHSYILGFCGCGMPEQNLKLIYDLLMLKEYRCKNKDIDFNDYDEMVIKYLSENIKSVKWFFDYYLDKKDITTHGGNVSGSWIDDKNFMDALKKWHQEREKSE